MPLTLTFSMYRIVDAELYASRTRFHRPANSNHIIIKTPGTVLASDNVKKTSNNCMSNLTLFSWFPFLCGHNFWYSSVKSLLKSVTSLRGIWFSFFAVNRQSSSPGPIIFHLFTFIWIDRLDAFFHILMKFYLLVYYYYSFWD